MGEQGLVNCPPSGSSWYQNRHTATMTTCYVIIQCRIRLQFWRRWIDCAQQAPCHLRLLTTSVTFYFFLSGALYNCIFIITLIRNSSIFVASSPSSSTPSLTIVIGSGTLICAMSKLQALCFLKPTTPWYGHPRVHIDRTLFHCTIIIITIHTAFMCRYRNTMEYNKGHRGQGWGQGQGGLSVTMFCYYTYLWPSQFWVP